MPVRITRHNSLLVLTLAVLLVLLSACGQDSTSPVSIAVSTTESNPQATATSPATVSRVVTALLATLSPAVMASVTTRDSQLLTATPLPATATPGPTTPALATSTVPAASITAVAGTPQKVIVVRLLPVPMQVLVKDSAGKPVSGDTVTFSAPTPPPGARGNAAAIPSGTFANKATSLTATSDKSGLVTAPPFTANNVAGSYVVKASVPGVTTPAEFNLTNLDIPNPPEAVEATAGDGQVSVKWSPPHYTGESPITGYNLYRLDANDNEVKLNTTPLTTTTFLDKDVSNNQEYLYMVTAINSVGESGKSLWGKVIRRSSLPVQGAPALVSAYGRSNKVLLFWSPIPVEGRPSLTGYMIYRKSAANPDPINIASLPATLTQFEDTGVTNGQKYTYTVTTLNSAGESLPSNALSAIPQEEAVLPGTPVLLEARAISASTVTVTWKAPTEAGGPDITGYHVYRWGATNIPEKINSHPLPGTVFSYTDSGRGGRLFEPVTSESLKHRASGLKKGKETLVFTGAPFV